jgi:tRNA A37 methylthiotransferase MiaB
MMKPLYDSGLRAIGWGVESGCQKILTKMHKATIVEDIEAVLKESADAGIKNSVFIMFGFPGETKEDFMTTIEFLKKNTNSIHLVTTSIFGLQKGSKVYLDPVKYGITKIIEKTRTKLDDQIFFELSEGLTSEEATILRKKFAKSIRNIDKLPRVYNYFREQVILL